MSRAGEYDAVIVGGGPAGLAAAFWLARYRRRVRVLDSGEARNELTWAVHGYPGLPDLPPAELRRRLREQAEAAGAEVESALVVRIEGHKDAFDVYVRSAPPLRARRVLLAYGVRDLLPDIPGLEQALGTSVFHCPDCDGPLMAGLRVGVIGWTRQAAALALFLRTWAGRLVLLPHGHRLAADARTRATLERYHVAVQPGRIVRVTPAGGRAVSLHLESGEVIGLDGLFFHIGTEPASDLAQRLGCETDEHGYLRTDRGLETTVPGVFAAGDITGHPHLAISAAARGVLAALAIHRSLLPPEWAL
ncbi:MAG: NAD(P)/FAD-dependent oxidoreductase [bacterium]|nr:MAG: NAD(P)/FAD-dependent oxidoreductase [bacterium]